MSEFRLTYLLQVYFDKIATPAERDELMGLLMQSGNDMQVKMLLQSTWQKFTSNDTIFSEAQSQQIIANIFNHETAAEIIPIKHAETLQRPHYSLWPAAAAIILFIVSGAVYFLLQPKQLPQQIVQSGAAKPFNKVIAAGGYKAVLTLADGSDIILDSTHQGTLAKQGNVKIMRLNTATVAYKVADENNQPVSYNTLSTPNGGQYQLILPDGSKVWLNASSSIHFPTVFKGKERNVSVTGEVYFEVAKNAAKPFKITVKDMEVQVLGTHFDIMAYDDESAMRTTLLEGSVKVTKGYLHKMLVPGQQSVINESAEIKVAAADLDEVMAWKNGLFQFNGLDIKTVMRQISRWYDVDVVYEGNIPSGHFTGVVNRSNDISQVLKIMQAGGVRFKIDGRKLVVLS
ncbi:MAG: FecR family protein [Ferruginibacter sp.]|nr:FecR family protein [Ferruginibacter sp.]